MTSGRCLRLIAIFAIIVPAFADDAAKRALAQEVLTLAGSEAMLHTMLEQQRAAVLRQMKQLLATDENYQAHAKEAEPLLTELQNRTFDLLQKALSWATLKPQFVSLYADTFSEEELRGLVAFYKSPTGVAFVKKMPGLASKSSELAEKQMQTIVPELQQLIRDVTEKARQITGEKPK